MTEGQLAKTTQRLTKLAVERMPDECLTRPDLVAGVTNHFLTDILGSPVAVTENAGTVQTE